MQQQISNIAFQMTLNVRNKVLSSYKDIMNMPFNLNLLGKDYG